MDFGVWEWNGSDGSCLLVYLFTNDLAGWMLLILVLFHVVLVGVVVLILRLLPHNPSVTDLFQPLFRIQKDSKLQVQLQVQCNGIHNSGSYFAHSAHMLRHIDAEFLIQHLIVFKHS